MSTSETAVAEATTTETIVEQPAATAAKPKRTRKAKAQAEVIVLATEQATSEAVADQLEAAGVDATAATFEQPAPEPRTDPTGEELVAALNALGDQPIVLTMEPAVAEALAAAVTTEAPAPEPVTFTAGGIALDAATTHETHRVIKVMSRSVKAACTHMFAPSAAEDAESTATTCADCTSMWNEAIGTDDPGDPAVIARAIDTLKAGKIAIPSVSENTKAGPEFAAAPNSAGVPDTIVPQADRDTVQAKAAETPADPIATILSVFSGESVPTRDVDAAVAALKAGLIVLKGTAGAARAPRAQVHPARPQAASAPRASAPRAAAGKPGKLRQVTVHGPFILGYRLRPGKGNGADWVIVDGRTKADVETIPAAGRDGAAAARTRAKALADGLGLSESDAAAVTAAATGLVAADATFSY